MKTTFPPSPSFSSPNTSSSPSPTPSYLNTPPHTCSLFSIVDILLAGAGELLDVADDGQVDVQETGNAVRHAAHLGLVELVGLDGGGDAFLPALVGEGVGLCLHPLALRLGGNEAAKLVLVLIIEEIEVGLRNIHCVGGR